MSQRDAVLGCLAAIGGRALLERLVRMKFTRDVQRLNAGDYRSLLAAYSDRGVLRFNTGDHRWSGDWHGREDITRFLQLFTDAGLQGEIRAMAISGPPWAATLWARFDDHADAPDGTRIYENQDVLVVRTRWGKIVEQQDFYADSARITAFDRALADLGITST